MKKKIVIVNVNPKVYDKTFLKKIKLIKNAEFIIIEDNKRNS